MQALTGVFCVLIGAIVGGLIMGLLIASSDFKMTELNSERIYESHKLGFRQGYSKALEESKNVVRSHMGYNKGYSFDNEMELVQEELDELKVGGKDENN